MSEEELKNEPEEEEKRRSERARRTIPKAPLLKDGGGTRAVKRRARSANPRRKKPPIPPPDSRVGYAHRQQLAAVDSSSRLLSAPDSAASVPNPGMTLDLSALLQSSRLMTAQQPIMRSASTAALTMPTTIPSAAAAAITPAPRAGAVASSSRAVAPVTAATAIPGQIHRPRAVVPAVSSVLHRAQAPPAIPNYWSLPTLVRPPALPPPTVDMTQMPGMMPGVLSPLLPRHSPAHQTGPGTMVPDSRRRTILVGKKLEDFMSKYGKTSQLPPPIDNFDDDLCSMFREKGFCPLGKNCLWRHFDAKFGMDYPTNYIKVTLLKRLERLHNRSYSRVMTADSRAGLPTSRAAVSPHSSASMTYGIAHPSYPGMVSSIPMRSPAVSVPQMYQAQQAIPHTPAVSVPNNIYSPQSMRSRPSSLSSDRSRLVEKQTKLPSIEEYWKSLIQKRFRVATKLEESEEISQARIKKLLDDNYDICWEFNTDDGCKKSGRCRWRHDKLVLRIEVGRTRVIQVDHPTRSGIKVNIKVEPRTEMDVEEKKDEIDLARARMDDSDLIAVSVADEEASKEDCKQEEVTAAAEEEEREATETEADTTVPTDQSDSSAPATSTSPNSENS